LAKVALGGWLSRFSWSWFASITFRPLCAYRADCLADLDRGDFSVGVEPGEPSPVQALNRHCGRCARRKLGPGFSPTAAWRAVEHFVAGLKFNADWRDPKDAPRPVGAFAALEFAGPAQLVPHIHALVAGVGRVFRRTREEDCGARWGWARLRPFKPELGASFYVSKYVSKESAGRGDYRLLGDLASFRYAPRADGAREPLAPAGRFLPPLASQHGGGAGEGERRTSAQTPEAAEFLAAARAARRAQGLSLQVGEGWTSCGSPDAASPRPRPAPKTDLASEAGSARARVLALSPSERFESLRQGRIVRREEIFA
jgi:hypothetical protein